MCLKKQEHEEHKEQKAEMFLLFLLFLQKKTYGLRLKRRASIAFGLPKTRQTFGIFNTGGSPKPTSKCNAPQTWFLGIFMPWD